MLHLTLNQRVAIARHGSWGTIDEGVYIVQKLNKVKAVLSRESDGHIRTFSVKTCKELGDWVTSATYVRSIEERERELSKRRAKDALDKAWANVQTAANVRNLQGLRDMIVELEKLV